MKKLILALSLLSSLSSCIKDIELAYPEGGGQLTLNSLLTADDTIFATLSSTLPYAQLQLNPYYKDGFITLYHNQQLVDTLRLCRRYFRQEGADSVWQYCSSQPVKAGHHYQLKAFRNGFPAVSASVEIPGKAQIVAVSRMDESDAGEKFEIHLADAGPEENYYLLEMRHEDPLLGSHMAELSSDDPALKLYSYFDIGPVSLDSPYGEWAFFNDKYFSNGHKKLIITARFSGADLKANRLILHSLSKDYYQYLEALAINKAISENPFYEAAPIKSNVSNGFGIVGGASLSELKLN